LTVTIQKTGVLDNEAVETSLFKKLNILPLYRQYTFSLSVFVVKNRDSFKLNSAVHSINTKQGLDLRLPITNLTKAQKVV